jgi:hypothetical protein
MYSFFKNNYLHPVQTLYSTPETHLIYNIGKGHGRVSQAKTFFEMLLFCEINWLCRPCGTWVHAAFPVRRLRFAPPAVNKMPSLRDFGASEMPEKRNGASKRVLAVSRTDLFTNLIFMPMENI